MIRFSPENEYFGNSIEFTKADLPRLIQWLERAANTLSPPDPELLKVLDDMKGMK